MDANIQPTCGHLEIASRAYASWLRRHGGCEVQDWLDAEAEIRSLYDLMTHAQTLDQLTKTGAAIFGNQLTNCQIRGAGLLAERIQAELRLNTEHTVTRTLAKSTDFCEAASPILQAICGSQSWDVGVIWVQDQDLTPLQFAGIWNSPAIEIAEFEKECRGASIPLSDGFPGGKWAQGVVVWIPDLTGHANHPRTSVVTLCELKGAVGYPIWNGMQFLGVMEFFSRSGIQPDKHVLEMMQNIGLQISQFIERKKDHSSFLLQQQEGRIAREIQQRLLPKRMPELVGFAASGRAVPASAVGGDCFDFITLPGDDGDDLGIVLADASGHGIGAALVVAETHAYLRALTLTCSNISELLSLTNRRLIDDRGTNLFVTLLFVRLDPRNRSIVYGGAGHCPGYVLDGRGLIRAVLTSHGMPLGVDSSSSFPTGACVQLQSNDLIFLYTDGVVEAGLAHGDSFGLERALQVVRQHQSASPDEILADLFEAVIAFSRGQLHDDLTAVIIKVEESPALPTATGLGRDLQDSNI